MNAQDFIQLLEHPESSNPLKTEQLREITREFPYFQAAQALYLKGLKNQESFDYNTALKRTAAHTTDRTVLFEYITSERFTQNAISDQIKNQEEHINNLVVRDEVDISALLDKEEQEKATKILDPNLFIAKKDSLITPKAPEDTLSIGKPLDFNKNEEHSFSEWLQLSSFKPIDRFEKETSLSENELSNTESIQEPDSDKIETESIQSEEEIRKRKQQIIDSFIKTNPKIKIKANSKTENKVIPKEPLFSSDALMTETLARVYVEQKNFKKAKQAFRILILKYPEKSGFFADQIRAVEQLEEQKE